jgi:hypothetical protein
MPSWYYFSRPSNMACHDLTQNVAPPPAYRSLLGLGLNFCVKSNSTHSSRKELVTYLERFQRDLFIKFIFNGSPDQREFDDNRLYISSTDWEPKKSDIPAEIQHQVHQFKKYMLRIFRSKKSLTNLTVLQQQTMTTLRDSPDLLVCKSDKNLGPIVVDRRRYVLHAFQDHLSDPNTYQSMNALTSFIHMRQVRQRILEFIAQFQHELDREDVIYLHRYLDSVKDPYPHFYLLWKIHKTPLKTRPIVSMSGSLLQGISCWLDRQLQPLCRQLDSFIASSWELVQDFQAHRATGIPLTDGRLFTCDAVSMYTNIDTDHALSTIKGFLRHSPMAEGMNEPAISAALDIVMRGNVFKFGNTFWKQLTGTAMGTPAAPMYATLYFGIRESRMPDRFRMRLNLYKRYIDDVIGVWLGPADNTWTDFQSWMNNFGQLRWTFSDLSDRVDFLDLTITIRDHQFHTTLFEKALNLYLYLPSHSTHPPGVLHGLIFGMLKRIHRLTSDPQDRMDFVRNFYTRLRRRGYSPAVLQPLFDKGCSDAAKSTKKPAPIDSDKTLFVHVRSRKQFIK